MTRIPFNVMLGPSPLPYAHQPLSLHHPLHPRFRVMTTPQQTPQSWTSWILDSYASSVVPLEEEYAAHVPSQFQPVDTNTFDPKPFGRISTAPTFEPKPLARVSTAPTVGSTPYIKTGRGGAGNYVWQAEKSTLPEVDGIEVLAPRQSSLTDRQRAAALVEPLDLLGRGEISPRKKSKQYLTVGVGGAASLALSQSNQTQSPRSPSFNAFVRAPTLPDVSSSYGRGGAGNWESKVSNDKQVETEKEYEERIAAERTRDKIEEDVERGLKRPEGAMVNLGRRDVTR